MQAFLNPVHSSPTIKIHARCPTVSGWYSTVRALLTPASFEEQDRRLSLTHTLTLSHSLPLSLSLSFLLSLSISLSRSGSTPPEVGGSMLDMVARERLYTSPKPSRIGLVALPNHLPAVLKTLQATPQFPTPAGSRNLSRGGDGTVGPPPPRQPRMVAKAPNIQIAM